MSEKKDHFPEQRESAKIHGTNDDVPKMNADSHLKENEADPEDEGHVKEWQDRARVVLDAKEAVRHNAHDKQSPDNIEDVEEKSKNIERGNENY